LMSTVASSRDEARENPIYQNHMDRVDVIKFLSSQQPTSAGLVSEIERMFSDEGNVDFVLSTVHRSKGLESDSVYIIHSDLMPSDRVKTSWGKQQELNLMYVAYTRAKSLLAFVTDFNAYKDVGELAPVSSSEPQGKVGDVISINVQILDVVSLNGKFGAVEKYIMQDDAGNRFVKMGSMYGARVLSGEGLKAGSRIELSAPVKSHEKSETILGTLVR
ncbi:hypothetical protein EOM86_11625, partial [Candidatus Nomurabacteria bacterium]|nr:hypothetical protein [Candidatus Nomurabacteria bacterium]